MIETTTADQMQKTIAAEGFAVLEGVLSQNSVGTLLAALAHVDESASVRKRSGVFAVRSLLGTCPEIAVAERVAVERFGPWSVKAGVLHVQPPAEVLEKMLTVHLHLDACGEENGVLHVLPGSHRRGRIAEKQIAALREEGLPQVCAVGQRGALLMRPMLLHASFPARVPGHRRVVHLDFAAAPLPGGLQWAAQVFS